MKSKLTNYIHGIDATQRSALLNTAIKPINMFLSFLYTPMLLNYLGTEHYGIWVTILSLILWINYFDVGIGHGLRNVLAGLLNNQDNVKRIQGIVSTAYILLTFIAGIVFFVLLILSLFVNWEIVFSTKVSINLPIMVSIVFICINFVLSLSNSILYAMENSELVSLSNIYIQIINVSGVYLLSVFCKRSLLYISILFGISTMIVYLYNTYLIKKRNPFIIVSLKAFDRNYIPEVCSIGIKFFVIQIMCLAMFTVDNILITHFFGSEKVTTFSITDKVFNTAYSVWAAFLIPYWSGTTVAMSNANIKWIKDSLRKIIKIYFVFVLGYIVLALTFNELTFFWLRHELPFQNNVIVLMCVFYTLYSILAIECQFINGTGMINIQLILYIILGLMNIPLSLYLGVYCDMGVFGIRFATTILVFIEVIVLGFNLKEIINKIEMIKIKQC